jgi:hypothetical protein
MSVPSTSKLSENWMSVREISFFRCDLRSTNGSFRES